MADPFRPALPTQYENPGATIKGRPKFGVTVERPSMAGLRDSADPHPELGGAALDKKLAEIQFSLDHAHDYDNSNPETQQGLDAAGAARLNNFAKSGMPHYDENGLPTSDAPSARDAFAAAAVPMAIGASHIAPPVGLALDAYLGADMLSRIPGNLGSHEYLDAGMNALGAGATGYGMRASIKALQRAAGATRDVVLSKGRNVASMMFPEELKAVQKSTDLSPAGSGMGRNVATSSGTYKGPTHGPDYNAGFFPQPAPAVPDNFIPRDYSDVAEQVGRGFNPKAEIQNSVRYARKPPMSDPASVSEAVTGGGFNPKAEIQRVKDSRTRTSMAGLQEAAKAPRGAVAARVATVGDDLLVGGIRSKDKLATSVPSNGARSVPSSAPAGWESGEAPVGAGPEMFQNQATSQLTPQELIADAGASSLDAIDEGQARRLLRELKARGSAQGVRSR